MKAIVLTYYPEGEHFSARLAGLPYKGQESGCYTGEYRVENGTTWYAVEDKNSSVFETTDEPQEIIDLTQI